MVAAAIRSQDGRIWTGLHIGATVGRLSVCAEAVALWPGSIGWRWDDPNGGGRAGIRSRKKKTANWQLSRHAALAGR